LALPRELTASSTAHERFQEWGRAGSFKALWQAGLREYDELQGIAASSTAILKSSGYPDATALVAGFRWAFFVSAGVAVAGVLVAVFVIDHHPNS